MIGMDSLSLLHRSADSVLDFKINIELHFVYLFCVLVYVLKYGNAGSYHCFMIIILSQ